MTSDSVRAPGHAIDIAGLLDCWARCCNLHGTSNLPNSVYRISEHLTVEWYSGTDGDWMRGFYLCFDESDFVYRIVNIARIFETIGEDNVIVQIRMDTGSGFSVTMDLDEPIYAEVARWTESAMSCPMRAYRPPPTFLRSGPA